jgi:hypothetical protein
MSIDVNNYTLGRGRLYFARYLAGTTTPDGFYYLGNSPEFNLTIGADYLDHFDSDAGVREKDQSIPLQINRTGTLTLDEIIDRNIALFFFGVASTVTTASATAATDTIEAVHLGATYKIGASVNNPVGVMGVDNVVLKVLTVTKVRDTDYELDEDLGLVTVLETGSIVDGNDLLLTYDLVANSRGRVVSGNDPVSGALMYIADNAAGPDHHYYMGAVKLTPNGDFAQKGDTWQQMSFNLDIQKPRRTVPAITMDGNPVYA